MNPADGPNQGAQSQQQSPQQQSQSGQTKQGAQSPKKPLSGQTKQGVQSPQKPQSGQKKQRVKSPRQPQEGQEKQGDQSPQQPQADKQKEKKEKKPKQESTQGAQNPQEGQKPGASGQGSPGDGPQLSKAELKKQRRELQEAQRAAKNKAKEEKDKQAAKKEPVVVRVPDSVKADVPETQKRVAKKLEKQQIPKRTTAQRKVRLFNHLQQYEREVSLTQSLQFGSGGIHPAIIKLGLQYAEGVISGSNARCVALLEALKLLIADYSTPQNEELCRDLGTKLKPNISFLSQCRPLSISMGNAIKYLKWHITNTPGSLTDTEAKERLNTVIDDFLRERILLAAQAIYEEANRKIADNDVILVYGCSSLVRGVLCDAHKNGKKFRVIVADSRPKLAGKEMLRQLVKDGISCTYVLLNTVSYVIPEATKVILGAHGLMANGFLMSTVGTSLVALIAKSMNIPVLVCCESYKFSERVQTDSFVFNELGDPDDLVNTGQTPQALKDWRTHSSLTLLNLVYDFTPPELVTMVVTEQGMIPCTSVPVVLRMRQQATTET